MDLSGYVALFGEPVTLEYDHRFAERKDLLRPEHRPNCVYGNILDEDLDFVGRFEDLPEVVEELRRILGVPTRFQLLEKVVSSPISSQTSALYTEQTWEHVRRLYANDLKRFDYYG